MSQPPALAVDRSNGFPFGIVQYGSYIPRYRLNRSSISSALGSSAGHGSRTVASYDEDTTTLAVEAARLLSPNDVSNLYFATSRPAYWHKANATAVHAALALDRSCFVADLGVSPRSAVAAFKAAGATGGAAVASDIMTGLPGSAEESGTSDGACAFRSGSRESSIAVVLSEASVSTEFIDRWSLPGEDRVRYWEERFGTEMYMPLIKEAGKTALDAAGLKSANHVVASSAHSRHASAALKLFGSETPSALAGLGYAGAADVGLRLAAALDIAQPGDTVLVLSMSDGCDAFVLQVTDRIEGARSAVSVERQLESGIDVSYLHFLTWRGGLRREPPRRPEPDRPAAPPSARSASWKFGFSGSRCQSCGFVHLPPSRQCKHCGAVDQMDVVRLADHHGTVVTFTVDRLAFSPAPPLIDVVVDFDGGGRTIVEMTDVAKPEEIAVGTRVEMTFRSLYTVDGIHNYFWKARPEGSGRG